MIASRNSAIANRLNSFAVVLLLAMPVAANAQIGAPTQLIPPGTDSEPVVQPMPPEADAPPAPTQPKVPSGISADFLAAPEPDAIGALSTSEQPLGMGLWQGSTKNFVMSAMPRIGTTTSPALSSLALRLLASPATPPEGDAPKGALIALRAERLTNALGRADVAYRLLGGIPTSDQSEIVGQISTDLAFLSGNNAAACAVIEQHDSSWQSDYWATGTTTCEALNGRVDDARLGLDLMRETKVKNDGFAALVELALGDSVKLPDTLPSPQPMALALLQKAESSLPKRVLETGNLAIIRAIALGSGFPPEQRLDATEKAASFGAVAPKQLAEAYLAFQLQPEDRERPINRAQGTAGSRGRAILFNAAHDAISPVAKANFLTSLLDKAPKQDLYNALVRALESLLLEVPVQAQLSGAAPTMARAFYALDRPEEAGKWLAITDPTAARLLAPLALIVDAKNAPSFNDQELIDLLKGDGKDAALANRRAVLATQLLAALNQSLPDDRLVLLSDAKGAVLATPGAIIDSESAAGHQGGTILAVLAALGDQGASSSGATLAQAIRGLRAVGLDDEARHLAIDAAIAAGL